VLPERRRGGEWCVGQRWLWLWSLLVGSHGAQLFVRFCYLGDDSRAQIPPLYPDN
jgi:hypothetical protein